MRATSNLVGAAVALMLVAVACTSASLDSADWTIPVPEGTPIIEYAAVPREERSERIDLVEDLVIGERGDDPNYSFYRLRTVRADAEGRIYVLDGGNNRIQVFGPDGEYLRTLGGPGSGPGEFSSAGGFSQLGLVIAGDEAVACDGMQSRISIWDSEGVHLDDFSTSPTRFDDLLAGLPDGSIIGETSEYKESETGERLAFQVISRFSARAEPMLDYVTLLWPPNFRVGRVGLMQPAGSPRSATTSEGGVYVTAGDEYQVLALDADGSARWALRVAYVRPPFTDEHRDTILDMLTSNIPDLDATGTEWPTHIGSISDLFVDGHGHLYVREFVMPYAPPPNEFAVDVYSPDGDRLFAGFVPNIRWTDAAGDFIYAIRNNDLTNEEEAVRYRIVEPF